MGKGDGLGTGRGDGKGSGAGEGSGEDYKGKTERIAVPAMPMPAAVVCCILNFLLPGFGTICAGFSSFCCSRNEDMTTGERLGSCCLSYGIGIAQILLTLLILIGWIWSCIWGGFFIAASSEYYHRNKVDMDAQATQGGVVLTQPRAEFVVQPAQPATQHVTQPGQPAGVYINPTTQYVVQPVMIYPGPSYPATQATKF